MATGPKGSAAKASHARVNPGDRGNIYGILVMQVSVFSFGTNDVFNKLVGTGLATGQMIFFRGICATIMVLMLCVILRQLRYLYQSFDPILLLRGLCETFSAIGCLVALKFLPLANVYAVLQAIPLATTAFAAVFLHETVGIRRWLAVLVGFVGVMAIVRPGLDGFNFYSLFAVAAVIFAAARDLITRQIKPEISLWVVTLTTMIVSTIGGGILALFQMYFSGDEGWMQPTTINLVYIAGAALFLTLGQYYVSIAMQNGEVSVVSSFRYVSMPIALVYGYLIWGEVPDSLTWFGIVLILASGIYTIFRERKVARLQRQGKRSGNPDELVAARTGFE
ncbi:DMT family transporter [Cohaesibacter haloalkalitolerans]|uniref:DMT family transporter n=1 Tax=Cohaesibacter haloalkalitolerans TaxID=1162980 RepID=UPI000E65E4C0|nr:DMT family transporter [Cohaesibacter haloalkalitolerans]